ncbi:hypothetical protein EcWSU1_A065 (plasmid) [Enterobacter ludwigii]|uniref:Uncharacterized protein n=1 Tax=Enterobacter ludwigii TaxID=299767 RepID=G8LQE3_9ENTR|nr:hypothetical protein EcWSU1_A065 [Enterobacter ludwigii]
MSVFVHPELLAFWNAVHLIIFLLDVSLLNIVVCLLAMMQSRE